jgi:hypothetical protein
MKDIWPEFNIILKTRVLVGHDRTLNYSQEGCCQLSQYYRNQNRNNYQKSKTICIYA